MPSISNLTNGDVFIICGIAFVLTLVIPRLIKRKKILRNINKKLKIGSRNTVNEFKDETKPFYTHNGNKNEIEIFLTELKNYAFRNSMKIVFPGTVQYNGKKSPTTMILVGHFGLLLIRCYGFGGKIYYQNGKWHQEMNDKISVIIDPILSMSEEEMFVRNALKDTLFSDVRVFTSSVFTRNNVLLFNNNNAKVFDKAGFFDWINTNPIFMEESGINVSELSDLLVNLVKGK